MNHCRKKAIFRFTCRLPVSTKVYSTTVQQLNMTSKRLQKTALSNPALFAGSHHENFSIPSSHKIQILELICDERITDDSTADSRTQKNAILSMELLQVLQCKLMWPTPNDRKTVTFLLTQIGVIQQSPK